MAKTKNLRKKNSILNFVAVVILTIIGIVLSVGNFYIPFTEYHYEGFARSISLGLDLAGGISVVYDCGEDAEDRAIEATVARLTNVIGAEYSEAVITRQENTRIRIEVPSETDSEAIFELIGDPKPLHITETLNQFNEETDIVGSDIEDVAVSYQPDQTTGETVVGVSVKFTRDGAKKFNQLTARVAGANQELHIYLGEVDEDNFFNTIKCENAIAGDSTFISGNFTYDQAKDYALQIMSGTFSCKLELLESKVISATLGSKALVFVLIGGAVGLALIMLLLWIRYGDFGHLANLALVIYIILMLFFLQAISFVQLTLPGLAGIVLSIGMAVDGTVIIFERVREEYKSGKKIPLSVRGGFKRAFWPIFDSNITTIITAVVLYILGTPSIQGFAITLLIGILLSMFMNLVILRFFVKWYLPINSVKGKKLHLPVQTRKFKEEAKEEVIVSSVGGQANEEI